MFMLCFSFGVAFHCSCLSMLEYKHYRGVKMSCLTYNALSWWQQIHAQTSISLSKCCLVSYKTMYTLISKWKNLQGILLYSSKVWYLKNDTAFNNNTSITAGHDFPFNAKFVVEWLIINCISTSLTKIAREIAFISKIQ